MNKVMQEDIKGIIKRDIKWEKLIGKTILITGATGMLGGHMLRTLVELNKIEQYDMKLYALVRNPDKVPAELRDDIELIVQSVTEAIRADVIFDYVIHAASPASPLIMKGNPVGTIAANSLGAFYTLELAKQSNAEGYLFISSREIYGQPYENQTMFQENTYGLVDPLDPRSCYPEGKKAAETMCACYRQQYGLNAKIARLAHTFGPGMSIDDGRVQADFIKNVVNHQDIVLKSEGTAVRTYTYVSDAVAALFYILLNSDDLVYNIASEESTVSIRDLAQALVDAFPQRGLKLVFDIPTPDKNTGCAPFTLGIPSSDKIRQLGWSPQYTLARRIDENSCIFEEN